MHDALRLAESVLFVDVLRRWWLNFSGFHSAGNHRNPRSNVNDKCNHTTHACKTVPHPDSALECSALSI